MQRNSQNTNLRSIIFLFLLLQHNIYYIFKEIKISIVLMLQSVRTCHAYKRTRKLTIFTVFIGKLRCIKHLTESLG